MARFYGSMRGNRGEATRMGNVKSGLSAHIRGWYVGVQVELSVNKDGQDVVTVYKTSGTNNLQSSELIAEFTAS
jgi:hypothetical protein